MAMRRSSPPLARTEAFCSKVQTAVGPGRPRCRQQLLRQTVGHAETPATVLDMQSEARQRWPLTSHVAAPVQATKAASSTATMLQKPSYGLGK